MKKLFLFAMIIGLMPTSYAQEAKAPKGKFSIELKYAANTDYLGEVVYNPELVLRWKMSSNAYFRIGFWMNQTKEVTQISKFDFGGLNNGYITDKSSFFSLKPAFDFPFKTSKTLQPYMSLEFPINYFMNKTETQDVLDFEYQFGVQSESTSPALTFGMNVKVGLNLLITSRFYAGAELGLGAVYVMQLSEKLTVVDDNNNDFSGQTESYGFFNYGMAMTTGVRVGCLF